jgi:hypothetical protein
VPDSYEHYSARADVQGRSLLRQHFGELPRVTASRLGPQRPQSANSDFRPSFANSPLPVAARLRPLASRNGMLRAALGPYRAR